MDANKYHVYHYKCTDLALSKPAYVEPFSSTFLPPPASLPQKSQIHSPKPDTPQSST